MRRARSSGSWQCARLGVAVWLCASACNREQEPRQTTSAIARAVMDDSAAITQKWLQAGGAAVLGNATSTVQAVPALNAQYQRFANGVIVDSPDYGAVLITAPILDKWLSLQGQTNGRGDDLFTMVGLPRFDFQHTASDISAAHDEVTFERGLIVAMEGGPSLVVYGDIYVKYVDTRLQMGLPSTEEATSSGGGRFQAFAGGEIHWTQNIGAFALFGGGLTRWKDLGGPTGPLGPPNADTIEVTKSSGLLTGYVSCFRGGVIFEGSGIGPKAIMTGNLLQAYQSQAGGPNNWLGYPIGEQGLTGSGDHYIDFEHGVLVEHAGEVLMFGTLDFFFTEITGFTNDCVAGICAGADTYSHLNIDIPSGNVVHVRRPGIGDYGSTGHVNETFGLAPFPDQAVANSNFTIDVTVDAWDSDDTSGDDLLGTVHQLYSIDNLWGRLDSDTYTASTGDGHMLARFRVRNHVPFDPSDRKGTLWWSFHNFKTPELTYDQFARVFVDVDPDEHAWRHPFNSLFYSKVFKTISKSGNCLGLDMESIDSEVGRGPYEEPIFQFFSDTQGGIDLPATDPAHVALMDELNLKHGAQLGEDVVFWAAHMFMTGFTREPIANWALSKSDFDHGGHPLMGVYTNGMFGHAHVVRPIEWSIEPCAVASECHRMKVLDPNVPKGVSADDQFIEIDSAQNRFSFHSGDNDYSGDDSSGGRMFYIPYNLLSGPQHTPYSVVRLLSLAAFFYVFGDAGKTNQITDQAGRTFFKPGLVGPPTRWDQAQPDALRIPNLAPINTFDTGDDMPMQMFFGQGAGVSHTFELVPAPGTAAGTPMEATFNSAKLSSHLSIPATIGQVDKFSAQNIETADKAVSVTIGATGPAKQITWTVAGVDKQRWAELSALTMAPAQTITTRVGHAGETLAFENNGPATSAHLRVNRGVGSTPVDLGTRVIPSGSSSTDVRRPVTTLVVGGQVAGKNGWLVAPVTISLTAEDLSGKGIDVIEYSRDQVNWTTYTGPFTYADEGVTSLAYRARDKAFNQEIAKLQQLEIDTRRPSSTGTVSTSGGVKLTYSVTDLTPGSGPAGVHALVKGSGGPTESFIAGQSGTATLATTCSALEFWGEDVAGNLQSPHLTVADSVKPVFTFVPAAVESSHCTTAGGLSLGTATATDDCGTVTVTNNAPAKFPLGVTVVTWTATDAAGNVKIATQNVTVALNDDASCCPAGTRVIVGTSGNDTLIGTASNECILGLGGNDTIEGRGGLDFIAGGSGDDNITGGEMRDYIWGGPGRDVIDGRAGDDFIDGGTEADNCSGGTGTNAILRCETASFCNASCCSNSSCTMPPPAALGCQAPYTQSSCGSYTVGVIISRNGHNWRCTNANCANCATSPSCAPGATGCPWGVVWADAGTCP